MKKIAAILAFVFLFAFITMVSVNSQEYIEYIDNSIYDNPKRPPAAFKHDEHNENAGIEQCNVCHHVYTDGEFDEWDSSEGVPCYECHAIEDSENDFELTRAYHVQCKGCHQKEKAGPVMCAECHVE